MRKIKKGDEIIVITGKDKGRRGTVSVVQDDGKIIVEGLNLAKKHQKGNPQAGISGGIVEKEMPLDASNVMLFTAKTGKGDRVGFKFLGEGEARRKVRYFKSNQDVLDA
ncbi:50S ribosomal protein L24 [uncultured Nevskia sp.]|uniref:50S ribosomal protein L24 n=1 Tax=uncultured Nevskia sp. TaxID=228950 RepID=UPI00345D5627